jgi:hypothetical protein
VSGLERPGSESADENRPFSHLVVAGLSAEGIEALSRVVATLPGDARVPIVIAQHLDPGVETMRERTELPGEPFRLNTHTERGTRLEIVLDATGGDE